MNIINITFQNTFPPVVALLKLFHPDGREAKLSFNTTMTTPLHLEELYQLNNFIQVFKTNLYNKTRLRGPTIYLII